MGAIIPYSFYSSIIPKPSYVTTWPAQEINPLLGTRYTDKVLNQMTKDRYHGFSPLVDNYATYRYVTYRRGGDGMIYTVVRIPGAINDDSKWINGFFEYIVSPEGTINHRFFNIK